uniref:EamA family transporter n=1 Tax=Aquiluna sp. TaxID=2053504 RepID=UPI004047E413
MTIIFGLLSAFSYGYADFVGALAAKRIRAVAVTAYSFSFGLLLAIVLSAIFGASYSQNTIIASIFAGVCSAIAITFLYAALALGPISIVSPLTAVVSAVIPVVVDVALGANLSSFVLVAVVLILIAVVLVAFVPSPDLKLPTLRATLYSVGAGLGFAGIFLFLDFTDSDSGLGPLLIMRVVGMVILFGLLFVVLKRSSGQPYIERITDWKLAGLILLASTGDVMGNVAFLIATRAGDLAVAAVLTSLYPVGTILLARIFLKERIAKSQLLGIVLALIGTTLIAAG